MTDATTPNRMTLSRVVELLLTRGARDRSAVTLTRNASGVVQIDVQVATGDSEEVVTAADASRVAESLFDALLAKYPAPAEHDASEVTYTRNAKGETQIAVSAKTTAGGDRKLAELADSTRTVYDRARMRYPMADGHTAKPGSVS